MTMESLPPENMSAGRSNSAATSRMMWMDWASKARRWLSLYAPVTSPASWPGASSLAGAVSLRAVA